MGLGLVERGGGGPCAGKHGDGERGDGSDARHEVRVAGALLLSMRIGCRDQNAPTAIDTRGGNLTIRARLPS
jgi:hypothetical protein